jgi:hypothetical protein
MEELVARLHVVLGEIDWLGRKPRPSLREPATDEEIAALEKKWGRPLPPTYENFLRLANGMEGAEQYDWAIAGATPPSSGDSFEDVKSGHVFAFKQKDPNHPVVQDLKQSYVAGADFDYQVVYFDPGTINKEEPHLRRVGLDVPYEQYPLFEDFAAFVAFVLSIYEDLLEFQNEPMGGGGAGGGDGFTQEDEKLLMELASLLEPKEPEPEPEPELSPEMQKAARLCHIALQKLLDADLVELVDAPKIRENLEDYMLRKLMRSKSPDETMDAWIYALSKAREVEELWGTDDELKTQMTKAFEQIAEDEG